jgi:hypothetical protein
LRQSPSVNLDALAALEGVAFSDAMCTNSMITSTIAQKALSVKGTDLGEIALLQGAKGESRG